MKQDPYEQFDEIIQQVFDALPDQLRRRFDEIPLVVEDHPSPEVCKELNLRPGLVLCGLHSGIPLTRRSVMHSGTLPTIITIFREGILTAAADKKGIVRPETLRLQIRKTVLHELGHHFGMTEQDLREYGYG